MKEWIGENLNHKIYEIASSKHKEQLYQSNLFHTAIEHLMYLDHTPTDEEYIQIISDSCKFADDYREQLVDEIMRLK